MTSCSYCANITGRGGKPKCLKGHLLGTIPVFMGDYGTNLLNVLMYGVDTCPDMTIRQLYRPTRFEKILYDPVL